MLEASNSEEQLNSGSWLTRVMEKKSVKVKVVQSCPTLCDPMVYTVHGILQSRILEWVAYPFPSRSFWPRNRTGVSCIAGGFFTSKAIRESLKYNWVSLARILEWVALLQGIFPTQGLNPGLPLWVDSLPAEPWGGLCFPILNLNFMLSRTSWFSIQQLNNGDHLVESI